MNLENRKTGKKTELPAPLFSCFPVFQIKSLPMLQHDQLTSRIIAAAINVHKGLGPGFLESVYEQALALELAAAGLQFERQKSIPIEYRGQPVGEHRLDMLVEDEVVVELKAATELEPIFFATVRSYLKAARLETGLLFNFAAIPLTIKRVGREHFEPAKQENQAIR
ncbi:MAG TPA: GxxExxY protein [Candidatus Limnocylindria bacterium]|nr:GxxExxY protein [Candidatus Limnocylindria bacterium]